MMKISTLTTIRSGRYYYAPYYYWPNPYTGNVAMKWGPYCGGETTEGDYLSVYYEPAQGRQN